MITFEPEFVEEFVKQCFYAGLNEDTTQRLLEVAHTRDLLATDPEFRAGFSGEVKSAGIMEGIGKAVGGLAKRWKALPTAGKWGVGTVGAAGAGLGAHRAYSSDIGSFLAGSGVTAASGPRIGDAYLPSWFDGSQGAGSASPGTPGSPGSSGSIFSMPGSGGASAAGGSFLNPDAKSMIGAQHDQLDSLNSQITNAQKMMGTANSASGLQGSIQSRHLMSQIADLTKQKNLLLSQSNTALGQMHADQGRSLRSIDNVESQLDQFTGDRRERANRMDQWFRNPNSQSWWGEGLNWLTGADNKADALNSSLQQADQYRTQLELARMGMNRSL